MAPSTEYRNRSHSRGIAIFSYPCTGLESSWPPSEWKLNSKDHVVFNKFLSSDRALLPQWGKSAIARASVSLAPVLGARALETGRTICHTLLQWILLQWVLPQWGIVWHHLQSLLATAQSHNLEINQTLERLEEMMSYNLTSLSAS